MRRATKTDGEALRLHHPPKRSIKNPWGLFFHNFFSFPEIRNFIYFIIHIKVAK